LSIIFYCCRSDLDVVDTCKPEIDDDLLASALLTSTPFREVVELEQKFTYIYCLISHIYKRLACHLTLLPLHMLNNLQLQYINVLKKKTPT
jgi:hypothetical protein